MSVTVTGCVTDTIVNVSIDSYLEYLYSLKPIRDGMTLEQYLGKVSLMCRSIPLLHNDKSLRGHVVLLHYVGFQACQFKPTYGLIQIVCKNIDRYQLKGVGLHVCRFSSVKSKTSMYEYLSKNIH